jgi:hypothetical protein
MTESVHFPCLQSARSGDPRVLRHAVFDEGCSVADLITRIARRFLENRESPCGKTRGLGEGQNCGLCRIIGINCMRLARKDQTAIS